MSKFLHDDDADDGYDKTMSFSLKTDELQMKVVPFYCMYSNVQDK